MGQEVKTVYRQPPPFPGFVGDDEPEGLALGDELASEGRDEADTGAPASEKTSGADASAQEESTDSTEAESPPTQTQDAAGVDAASINPDATYVLDDGTKLKGSELRARLLQARELEERYARIHPYEKLLEFYETVPEFRQVVDEAGKRIYAEKVLGVPVADDDDEEEAAQAPTPKDPEEWVKKFDENPLEALNEWGKQLGQQLEKEIKGDFDGSMQGLQQMFDQALTVAQRQAVADAVWQLLEAEIGDDFPKVYEEVGKIARQLAAEDPLKFRELNDSPAKTARLVRETWLKMRKDKGPTPQTTTPSNPAATAPARNQSATSDAAHRKSIWDLPKDKFLEIQRKILLGG